jgi:hypothetical protein
MQRRCPYSFGENSSQGNGKMLLMHRLDVVEGEVSNVYESGVD